MFTGVQTKLIQIKTENQFRKPKPKKTNFFLFGYSFVKTAQLDYGY
jgi:DNA-binding transcriptional MocR family regulator